jgi:hypothetical protein
MPLVIAKASIHYASACHNLFPLSAYSRILPSSVSECARGFIGATWWAFKMLAQYQQTIEALIMNAHDFATVA